MPINRPIVYSTDLVVIMQDNCIVLKEIKSKLDNDNSFNIELFLKAATVFEATLRLVMTQILLGYPDKLKNKAFTISKKELCNLDDHSILISIVNAELSDLSNGSTKEQLIYAVEIASNISIANLKNTEIINIIAKCSDISQYRNCIIGNAGTSAVNIHSCLEVYKVDPNLPLVLDKALIEKFFEDYLSLFDGLAEMILKNIEFIPKTRIGQLRRLWKACFSSPLLLFDEYWTIDEAQDLVTEIKYPDCEQGISSSEKIYLSIWRHQFYDAIKTEEFLLCSVNDDEISKIYEGLSEVQFYYMYQQSH